MTLGCCRPLASWPVLLVNSRLASVREHDMDITTLGHKVHDASYLQNQAVVSPLGRTFFGHLLAHVSRCVTSERTLESKFKILFLMGKILGSVLVTGSYPYPKHT